MIVNTRKSTPPVGFTPGVDNEERAAKSIIKGSEKALWGFLVFLSVIPGAVLLLFIIPWVKWYKWRNWFRQAQIAVNNAASSIDVSLARRRDTLIKLVEQTKAYMKFESSTFADVTKLRSMRDLSNITQANEAQAIMDKIASQFNINVENYPMLKANSTVQELMSASQYVESEIAASRRLYNQAAMNFNQEMVVFPKIVTAARMGLVTFAMFAASETQRQDVDMSGLSNYNA